MKKLLIIIFLQIFISKSYSQWFAVDSISMGTYCGNDYVNVGVDFLNDSEAYWYQSAGFCDPTYGGFFAISRTANSFSSTQEFVGCGPQMEGDESSLGAAYFISFDTVYISCSCDENFLLNGFLKTTDGGNTWNNIASSNISGYLDFINGHLGYGFSDNNLYRFYNDTSYFVSTITNFAITNYQMYFEDSLNGFILLQPDTVIKTSDGGVNWSLAFVDSERTFSSLELLNDSVIYIYADSGYIYKTKDAGNSWRRIIQNDTIGDMHFLNEQRAYSVSTGTSYVNNYYYVSNDSGFHWSSSPIPNIPNGFDPFYIIMFNDSVGYIEGWSYGAPPGWVIVLKTTNGGVGIHELTNNSLSNLVISPNPATNQLTIHASFHSDKPATIFITNVLGQEVSQYSIVNNQYSINISFLPAGLYFLQMKTESGSVVQRFVKE